MLDYLKNLRHQTPWIDIVSAPLVPIHDCMPVVIGFVTTQKEADVATACVYREWKQVTAAVKQRIRQEDREYFASMADRAGKAATQSGLHALWRQIKGVLPKNKQKRQPCLLGNQMAFLAHFEQLEAGTNCLSLNMWKR